MTAQGSHTALQSRIPIPRVPGSQTYSILVSCGYCYKVPQTGWPKPTEMYSFIVSEARGLQSRCRQGQAASEGSRGDLSLASSSFQRLHTFLSCGCILPVSAPTCTGPSTLLCLLFLCLRYRHVSPDTGPIRVAQDDFISRSLMTPTKPFFQIRSHFQVPYCLGATVSPSTHPHALMVTEGRGGAVEMALSL